MWKKKAHLSVKSTHLLYPSLKWEGSHCQASVRREFLVFPQMGLTALCPLEWWEIDLMTTVRQLLRAH